MLIPKIGWSQSGENFNIMQYTGNIQSFPLDSINKITFISSNLTIHFNNGTTQNWNTSDIDYYYYQSSALSISENIITDIKLDLYPNPTGSVIHISGLFNPNDRQIKLDVYDNIGRLILSNLIFTSSGLIEKNLNLSNFVSGLYYFNFTTTNGQVISKKIYINE